MSEKRFKVLDASNEVLIKGATFEMAIVFIKGFYNTFYNEILDLRIVEDAAT